MCLSYHYAVFFFIRVPFWYVTSSIEVISLWDHKTAAMQCDVYYKHKYINMYVHVRVSTCNAQLRKCSQGTVATEIVENLTLFTIINSARHLLKVVLKSRILMHAIYIQYSICTCLVNNRRPRKTRAFKFAKSG